MNRPRALVTGASGFVGSYLVPHLCREGMTVFGTSRRPRNPFSGVAKWISADLTREKDAFRLIRTTQPDYVFHLAGVAVPAQSVNDPAGTFRINVTATLHLMEGILRFAPRSRLLLVSSSHVYGRTFHKHVRVRERDSSDPTTPYGVSKRLTELAALDFFCHHGLRVVIARGFNQVGVGLNPYFVFPSFCRQVASIEAKKRRPVLEVGNLSLVRDFIHVEDAVRAYSLLIRKGKSGEIYNVGSGRGLRLRKAVEFLKRKSRVPFQIRPVPGLFRRGDSPYGVADPSKLEHLGWKPRRSIFEGLESILDEWRVKVGAKDATVLRRTSL